jgi:hypothetical protein
MQLPYAQVAYAMVTLFITPDERLCARSRQDRVLIERDRL